MQQSFFLISVFALSKPYKIFDLSYKIVWGVFMYFPPAASDSSPNTLPEKPTMLPEELNKGNIILLRNLS